MSCLRERFFSFDDDLAARGVPPLTAWWREGIGRWLDAYERHQVLELWACVGRGAAKSSVLYKLALFFTLFGDVVIPPAERHYAIVLSRLKEEAAKGIGIIRSWLELLGIPHHLAGDVLDLDEMPRGIRVVAASVAATSGFRAYLVAKDERSKFPSGGVDEQDADEIDTSAAAMTATHALAPILAFGSAWGAAGTFYEAIDGGSDDQRVVLGPTPTWIAAPHISEASTRKKERDPRRWAREYQCCFSAGVGSAFDADMVGRLPAALRLPRALGEPVMFIDSSSGKADAWAWCTAQHILDVEDEPTGTGPLALVHATITSTFDADPLVKDRLFNHAVREELRAARALHDERTLEKFWAKEAALGVEVPEGEKQRQRQMMALSGTVTADAHARGHEGPQPKTVQKRRLYIDRAGAIEGKFSEVIPFPVAVARAAEVARSAGATRCFGDQYLSYPLTSEFAKYGVEFVELPWTAPAKIEAAAMLRVLLADQTIAAQPGEETTAMCEDLLALDEVLTKTGAITVQARRTRRGHGDRGMLAMLIARAESEGRVPGSATERSRERIDYQGVG